MWGVMNGHGEHRSSHASPEKRTALEKKEDKPVVWPLLNVGLAAGAR